MLFEEGDELVGGLFLVLAFDFDGDLGALAELKGEDLHDGGDVAGSVAVAQKDAARVVHEGLHDDCRGAAVDALGVLDGCGPCLHGVLLARSEDAGCGSIPKIFRMASKKNLKVGARGGRGCRNRGVGRSDARFCEKI